MNVTSSSGFTPTLPVSQASNILVTPQGEQDPAVQATSVKQAAESDRPDLREKQQQSQRDSALEQQRQQDLQVISDLAARDREVRAHEQAHASVGGAFAGSPSYTTEQGPNGVSYAVGGEVSISTSPVPGDAEATIRKADVVRRAALAPADPSAQDRAIAAQAAQMKIQAQVERASQEQETTKVESEQSDEASDASRPAAEDDDAKSTAQSFLDSQLMTEQILQQDDPGSGRIDQLI